MLKIVLCLVLMAAAMFGQTAFYVGGGPSGTMTYLAGNLTFGICTPSAGTCSLTSLEARGSGDPAKPREFVYSTQTGIKQRLAQVIASKGTVELFTLAQGGAVVTPTATSGIVGMGGGVLFKPAKWPGWSISVPVRAVYAPTLSGWEPWASVHVGYTFR